jgi:DNA-binding IclR family transcriptional regulator
MTEASSNERGQNKASGRILAVLSGFASDTAGFGITELSNLLGMTKNMIYRALSTLVEQGYVVRAASGQRYQLGYRVLELQNIGTPEPDLRALAAPAIRQFYEVMGETVSLIVRALDYAVFIDGVETRRSGTFRLEIGAIRPLHGPGSGLVMLAFGSDQDVEEYLKRHPRLDYPGRPTMTAKELWAEIRAIRARGYGQMLHPGALPMLSIAFPIWSADDRLHGVITTGGPVERFAPLLDRSLPQLQQIVNELVSRTRLYPAARADRELG